MPLPDFTDDEKYLINCAKSKAANLQANSYMWVYLVGGALLAGFAAYHENVSNDARCICRCLRISHLRGAGPFEMAANVAFHYREIRVCL